MNILIVDDDKMSRYICRKTLQGNFKTNHIYEANNGAEALAIISGLDCETDLDFILLDLHMPGMDGFELSRAIHAKQQNLKVTVPIAMISSSIDPDDITMAMTLGLTYFMKPISFENLSSIIPSKWLIETNNS